MREWIPGALDAAIIRSLLAPATMRLVGRWNWWLPGRPDPPKQVEGAGVIRAPKEVDA